MADTSVGQVQAYFQAMSDYYDKTGNYYGTPTGAAPLFMELLSKISFTQVVTESNQIASSSPSMISGALIESANSMFATLREASLRAKTRADFWAEAETDTSLDSQFYSEQSQMMAAYIRGKNPSQN